MKHLKKSNDVKVVTSVKPSEIKDTIYFSIPGNRNMEDLKKELLLESKKNEPYAITIYLNSENNISLDEIIEVGSFIKQNNISTIVRSGEEVNFKKLAFIIFCSSHLIFFDMSAIIDMGSHNLKSQKKLQEIVKKMSEVIVCDEKELVKYCNRGRLIGPEIIFEEEDKKYIQRYIRLIQYHFAGSYYKRRK